MFKAIFIALCTLLLSACGADKLYLSLHTSNVINPDNQHRALSLYLKVFQLKSLRDFKDQPLNALWMAKTNSYIVAIDTVVVQSNESQTVTLDLNPQTRFIGIVADFRQPDETQRLIIPIKEGNFTTNQLSLLIQDNHVERIGS